MTSYLGPAGGKGVTALCPIFIRGECTNFFTIYIYINNVFILINFVLYFVLYFVYNLF